MQICPNSLPRSLFLLFTLAPMTGCLESGVIECSWGLYCPAEQVCHEGLRRCVLPVQLQVCKDEPAGAECTVPGIVSKLRCRQGACTKPECGDGVRDQAELGEECDDGNIKDYDGCSRDCRSEKWRWSRIEPAETSDADPPAGLVSLAYDEQNEQVILLGGERVSQGIGNETWVLELSFKARKSAWPPDGEWKRKEPGTSPQTRVGQAMVFDKLHKQVVLFGGKAGETNLDDTWTFDGTEWTDRTPPIGFGPSVASGHQLVWDDSKKQVLLWGGQLETTELFQSPLWAFDGEIWQELETNASPPPRSNHVMVYDAGQARVLITGGYNERLEQKARADTWAFDGSQWQELSASLPSPLQSAAAAFDHLSGQIILYGGVEPPAVTKATTLTFRSQEVGWQSWLPTGEDEHPGPRRDHRMVSLGKVGGVLLFGGKDNSGKSLNDAWVGRYYLERICGNGLLEQDEGEGCDGEDLGELTCESLGYKGGQLECTARCEVDTSACIRR